MYELQRTNTNVCSFIKISGAKWVKSDQISTKFLSGQVEAGKNILGIGQFGLKKIYCTPLMLCTKSKLPKTSLE